MDDVVAAINVDLTAASGNAVASFDTDTNSFTFNALTGTAGSGSSITLGGDLDVLQFGSGLQLAQLASTAIENINISTASGATSALASIDNALDRSALNLVLLRTALTAQSLILRVLW